MNLSLIVLYFALIWLMSSFSFPWFGSALKDDRLSVRIWTRWPSLRVITYSIAFSIAVLRALALKHLKREYH